MNENIFISKFIIGLVLTIILIKIIKKTLKIKRPNKQKKTYGMPSTRTGIFGFIIFFLLFNFNINIYTKFLLFISLIIVSALKYYFEDHTINQLLFGFFIGFIISLIFYKF